MRRRACACVLVGLAVVLGAGQASGDITLAFDPSSQTVGLGESVDVAITIAGLVDFDAPSLGGFGFDVLFDDSILSLDDVVFGDPVLGDQLDLFGLGHDEFRDDTSPGTAYIFELSYDSEQELNDLQADSFTLATLTFDTVGLGTSGLLISLDLPGALSDSLGSALNATAGTAQVAVVSAPSAMLLGALGVGIVGWMKRRPLA